MIKIKSFSLKKANTGITLRIMKLITLFLILGMSVSFARSSYSQTTALTINVKDKTVKDVFSEIESNSQYVFLYNDNTLDTKRKVSINISNKTIYSILEELFKGTDNIYKVADRQIFISSKSSPEVVLQNDNSITVKGNVTDMKGEPLIGVTILLKDNPKVGTATDIDGNYTIKVPDRFATLQYNYIGFVPKQEVVGNRKIINVILLEDVGQLDEVVVVGYGSQKKASVVGSISTIEPQRLQSGTTRSLSNNLAGNIGGIIGAQRSGEPGYDNSEYWIRGISTFAGGAARKPLVLIDGIERSLDNIDTEEIESFSVLKDASATAVYGVRGANGVIIITTKRGKVGRTIVRVNVEQGMTEAVKIPEFLGAADYMQLLNDIQKQNSPNERPIYAPERIEKTRLRVDDDLYPDINWLKAISNDRGYNTHATIDVSGGTERLRYALVTAYYHEDGILKRDKRQEWNSSLRLDRYNVRSNMDLDVTPTTLLRVNIGGFLQRRFAPPVSIDDIFKDAFSTPPFVHPPQYSSGQIPKIPERVNPWANATQRGYERDTQSKLETLVSVDQDLKAILPGLKARLTFSFDNFSRNGVKRAKDPEYYNTATGRDPETGALQLLVSSYGQEFLGYEEIKHWGDNSTYLEGNVSYSQTFNSIHAVDALVLYNQRDYDKGEYLPFRNQGFAGRFSYTLSGKYIAEFNFGYNGSENFAKGKRYGFFPSIAAGWILSEEGFMKPLNNIIHKAKFRFSHGKVGNDKLDGRRFAYITTIKDEGDNGGYYWGNMADFHRNGKWEGDIGVPNMTWETVTKTNLGLELGLWNTIELQVDYFNEKRRDIFQKRNNFPNSAGFASLPWANFGKVDNSGFDITLDANKQINKDLFISVRGTLTYAKNKIIEQDEDLGKIGTNRSSTGLPVGHIFGLIDEGLFTEDDFKNVASGVLKDDLPVPVFGSVRPGDIKYKDVNGDGVIDDNDRSPIGGTVDPQLVYGFGANITYKGFDFGVLFQGNGKTYRTIGRGSFFLPGSTQGATGNIYANAYDSWTIQNPSQDVFYPRLTIGANANNSQESTWWLRDMSMLRLKNMELGYSFPRKLIRNAALESARIFVRGTNLFCFSNFKLWDPELDTMDNNGLKYPIMKSYSVGIQLHF